MGTARRHLSSIIESEGTNVYSLEMSMLGYKLDRKSDKIHPYTEDHCRDTITITAVCMLLCVQTSSRAAASAGRCTTSTRSADTSRQSPSPRRRSW